MIRYENTINLLLYTRTCVDYRNFKGNRQLSDLDVEAFAGLSSLQRLDLSQTAVQQLPTIGLGELEILRLVDTKSLKKIPSVYNYQVLYCIYCTHSYCLQSDDAIPRVSDNERTMFCYSRRKPIKFTQRKTQFAPAAIVVNDT